MTQPATAKSEAEGAAGRAADSEANAGRSATSAENAKTDAEQAKAAAEEAAADARAAITLWPIISTKTGTWMIYDASRGEYVDTGESANGLKGEDGIAPHIGSNGHWYVGNTDTGVAAVGPAGENGVGIADVMVTSGFGDGATNEITLYLSDGRTATMGVKNGSKGSKGEKGNDGITPEFTLTQEKTEGGSVINVGIKTGDKSEYRFIEVKDGQTPYIGPNGNLWVGETDTGASADGAGTTVMYVNGDGYLYSTEDTSDPVNRVTLSQLRMLIERGGEVAVETRYKDTVYRSLGCTAGFTEVYGWLAASTVVEGIDAAVHMMYYTAEYVEPPPVELYAGEDRYLYRTEDISDPANRLTVEELRNIDVPRRDVVVWLCEGEEQIEEKPYRIEDYEEWGTIGVIKQGMLYWLYTAEYTGPMAAYSFAQENTDEWEVTEE